MSVASPRLRIGLGIAALALVVYTGSLVCVLVAASADERVPADAIVVLGAAQYNGRPSPVLRARLDHARELFQDGLAPRIVVTGGTGDGDLESEAAVSQRYLVLHGVPAAQIVVAPVGRSTEESMTAVAKWLTPRGLTRVLLVSDAFHQLRLKLEARRTGLTAHVSATETSPISDRPRVELRFLLAEAWKAPIAWLRSL